MASVGSYEAKTRLAELLRRTAKGEQITITKHGKSVAVLVPPRSSRRQDTRSVIQDIKQFRKGRRLGGACLRKMIEEGRRF